MEWISEHYLSGATASEIQGIFDRNTVVLGLQVERRARPSRSRVVGGDNIECLVPRSDLDRD